MKSIDFKTTWTDRIDIGKINAMLAESMGPPIFVLTYILSLYFQLIMNENKIIQHFL